MIRLIAIASVGLALLTAQDARADRAEARGLVLSGQMLARAGDLAGALARYERAIASADDYLPAYEAAIPLWLGAKRFQAARGHLERVTLRHPNHADAWYALAYVYRRLGRPKLAIAAYHIYMPLRPQEVSAWFGIAMAHKQAGQRALAIKAFRRYAKRERDPARKAFVTQADHELYVLERWQGAGGPAPELRADGVWVAATYVGRPADAATAIGLLHAGAVLRLLAAHPIVPQAPASPQAPAAPRTPASPQP